jgi:hypothetical protein
MWDGDRLIQGSCLSDFERVLPKLAPETILVGKLITYIIQTPFAKLIRDMKRAFILAVRGKDKIILVPI